MIQVKCFNHKLRIHAIICARLKNAISLQFMIMRWHGGTMTTISNMNTHVGSEAPIIAGLVLGAVLASPIPLSFFNQLLHSNLVRETNAWLLILHLKFEKGCLLCH